MKSNKFKTKKAHIISLLGKGYSNRTIATKVGCHEHYVCHVAGMHKTREEHLNDKEFDQDFMNLVAAFNGSPKPDMVNSPPHYTSGGIETIDYMEAKATPEEFAGHLRLTAIKYLSRAGMKGDALEDFKKAQWYLNRLVTFLQKHKELVSK